MKKEEVQAYFNQNSVVDHYHHAAVNIGLWSSEKLLFSQYFPNKEISLLELGAGAGRIALGLWDLGYTALMVTDYCPNMVERAQKTAALRLAGLHFQVEDATKLSFRDNQFAGTIFGFNGLMQIPGRQNRIQALREIYRVLKGGSLFIFTSHDREALDCMTPDRQKYWKEETELWQAGQQAEALQNFGDLIYSTEQGELFIHIPTYEEIEKDLAFVGFKLVHTRLRSAICQESSSVQEFSDNCRFWVVQKL